MTENKANEPVEKQGDLQTDNLSEQRINKNSLKNLKPYPKGVSGNPGGRKKNGLEFFEFLKEVGMLKPDVWQGLLQDSPDSYVEGVATGLWKKAIDGDLNVIKFLVEVGALNQRPRLTKEMIESRIGKKAGKEKMEKELIDLLKKKY